MGKNILIKMVVEPIKYQSCFSFLKEHCLIELIKYGSKIFTEPDIKEKKTSKVPPRFMQMLCTIFFSL